MEIGSEFRGCMTRVVFVSTVCRVERLYVQHEAVPAILLMAASVNSRLQRLHMQF